MELTKRQVKDLRDNINWVIEDPNEYLDIQQVQQILNKSLIDYEE